MVVSVIACSRPASVGSIGPSTCVVHFAAVVELPGTYAGRPCLNPAGTQAGLETGQIILHSGYVRYGSKALGLR
jgi:hypothetical protein